MILPRSEYIVSDFSVENVAEYIDYLTEAYFQCGVRTFRKIGEGFYGAVYLVEMDKDPICFVVKWYKIKGHYLKEAQQLKLLREHAWLPIPEVYHVHSSTDGIPFEALLMEYIEGKNAAGLLLKVSVKLGNLLNRVKRTYTNNESIDSIMSFSTNVIGISFHLK
jgi:predicted Ser/Thr protein kinase